jgi:hypothetical protein
MISPSGRVAYLPFGGCLRYRSMWGSAAVINPASSAVRRGCSARPSVVTVAVILTVMAVFVLCVWGP